MTDEPLRYLVSIDPASPALRDLPPGTRIEVTIDDPDDPANELLTPKEAAAAGHVPASTFRSWVHRGLLAPVETAGGKRYRASDVMAVELATRGPDRVARLNQETEQLLRSEPS